MHKTITAAALTGVCAIAVAGCGGSSGGSSSGGSSGGSKSLALIQGTKADDFYVTMGCGAQSEAKKLGYSITVQGPAEFSAPEQIPIVNSVTAQKPGAVMIAPTNETALIEPMKQMKSAGIKVVQVDTTVSEPSMVESSISSDNVEGGELGAKTLAKLVGEKGSVVVMNEQPGVSTTDQRVEGFEKAIKAYPNIKLLKTQYVGDNPTKAAEAISSLLSANPDLSGVFATNVLVADGVDTGLKNAGAQEKVKIVGYDADPKQVEDLESGVVQALIVQDPFQEGVEGVKQAVNAIEGKPVEKSILTKTISITKENLSSESQYIYKSSC